MTQKKTELFNFATHKINVDTVTMHEGAISRVSLLCVCCSPPMDMYLECTYDDFQYLLEAGYVSRCVEDAPAKKEAKGLECLFGEGEKIKQKLKKRKVKS